MIPAINRTDVIGGIGDSIMYGFAGQNGWMFSFSKGIRLLHSQGPQMPDRPTGLESAEPRMPAVVGEESSRQPTGYQDQTYPSFIMDAVPGATVGTYAAIINTTLVPFIAMRTTVYFVELGINDATAAVPAATFTANVTTVRDAILAAPFFRMLVWIGPGWAGEKYPDGSNPFDTIPDGIKDKDAQLATLMAVPNCYYISWRTLRISSENATTNPGNAASGVYTVDGTHLTTNPTSGNVIAGEQLATNYTLQQLSVS